MRSDTVDLSQGRFMDPRLLSTRQTTNNVACHSCCGGVCMTVCFPCALVCGGCGYSITVDQGEAGIMTSFGKYVKTLSPGFYYINTCLYQVKKISMKLTTTQMAIASVQTSDGLTISVNGYISYKCQDPFLMAYAVANIDFLIKDLATGILKRLINKNTFRTILLKKQEIAREIQKKLSKYMAQGGVIIPFSDIT